MLNYAGEDGEYRDAHQAAVTGIRSMDATLRFCLEWLTMSYIISDSAYLIFSAYRLTWISLEMYSLAALHANCSGVICVLILARPHTSQLLHYVTPALVPHRLLCIPASQYSQYSPA